MLTLSVELYNFLTFISNVRLQTMSRQPFEYWKLLTAAGPTVGFQAINALFSDYSLLCWVSWNSIPKLLSSVKRSNEISVPIYFCLSFASKLPVHNFILWSLVLRASYPLTFSKNFMWISRCPGNWINDVSFDTGNIVADSVLNTYVILCKNFCKVI